MVERSTWNKNKLPGGRKTSFFLNRQLSYAFDVIFQKRVRVFYRSFQRRELIVFECLENPVKHEARVFEMASQSAPNCKQKKEKKTKKQKKAKII